ncbi:MAG: tRNA (adenosine(37)-N6)-threonylcarbamoyltransferase complex ATPase subunit type 1 TsaE [Chlorobium sp.]|jgi:tRNA threonylcarbamoyladenosine biosynthesis protein TsaE|nr:MAG: tRNA (adenosine(37)-N6)-threonylcarbamoyltransferase complex ATPase subunit type 1 TsaE [Chlorobium sp.]
MTEELLSSSAEETRNYGWQFASWLQPGEIVSLSGQLGAGKTVFMRGIAEFFNCDDQLTSPTFPILNIYQGFIGDERVTLHHFDLYRIQNVHELEVIGFDEFLSGGDYSFVEWADRFPEYGSLYTATVNLVYEGEDRRRIVINRTDQ